MGWTSEQQKVIDLRDRNILVSAAAGSGKTAVLVERIIKRITDREHPVDIDELLVVTFTNAAAAEMRERIGKAINKALEERPEDENLLKQVALIHNAKITTIDSFCNYIVRNHFGEIGLDPNFRIADQGEVTLLKQDTVEELFEDEFKRADEKFICFVDTYSSARSTKNVKDMVLALANKSESASWPMEWLDGLTAIYQFSEAELEDSVLFRMIKEGLLNRVRKGLAIIPELLDYAKSHEGMEKFVATLEADQALLQRMNACTSYDELVAICAEMNWVKAGSIANKPELATGKAYLTSGRNSYKETISSYASSNMTMSIPLVKEQNDRLLPYIEELVRLAKELLLRLEDKKKKKRMMDFCDIEHYALRILREEEPGHKAKKTAMAFRQHFAEIMIDEYQDSNQVQEDILSAISRMEDGTYNMFMVGDVKQSIYRFRQAKPELFMEKYGRYSLADVDESGETTKEQKIELRANFRSRPQVLEMANDLCYKLMSEDLGGVPYTEEVALNPASTKYDSTVEGMDSEVLMFCSGDDKIATLPAHQAGKRTLEARMIASRIQALVGKLQITEEVKTTLSDGTTKSEFVLRPMRYGDVVILLRSNKGWGDTFADTLNACGIPAHVESSTGYFSASEVVAVLDLLRILDNPYQDIPMATVLKSQFVGLSDEELAKIRIREGNTSFSHKAIAAMEEATEGKLYQFAKLYKELRGRRDLPIQELLQLIFDRSGYDKYVAALPAGERRLANLAMLMEKAVAFEQTSYKGLFHFVRYIDQLHKYEVDYGEAETASENSDMVRIMTIHKSKGLEFPVVFVAGMGKKFNRTDEQGEMVLHSDYGIGIVEKSLRPRTKKKSMLRDLIALKCSEDMLGEEARMLYVAFTRASEKMILSGTIKDEAAYRSKVGNAIPHMPISYDTRYGAQYYTDWLLPALVSYRGGAVDKYPVQFFGVDDLIEMETERKLEALASYEEVLHAIDHVAEEETQAILSNFAYEYPYKTPKGMKIKYAVSDLKHLAMEDFMREQEDARLVDFVEDVSEDAKTVEETEELRMTEQTVYVPRFARGEDGLGMGILADRDAGANPGALRGTATHRIMECIDYVALSKVDRSDKEAVTAFVSEQTSAMIEKGLLTKEQNALVKREWVVNFLMNDVAGRMAAAAVRGELFKEQPFVMRYTGEKYANVLIQGIIDVFWKEEDRVVVLDYKTDHVDTREQLVGLYKEQLDLYGYALCKAYGIELTDETKKETLIYSFRFQEVITL